MRAPMQPLYHVRFVVADVDGQFDAAHTESHPDALDALNEAAAVVADYPEGATVPYARMFAAEWTDWLRDAGFRARCSGVSRVVLSGDCLCRDIEATADHMRAGRGAWLAGGAR